MSAAIIKDGILDTPGGPVAYHTIIREQPTGHYERIPLPADPRLPERRFTVGKFVRAEEEPSR